MVNYFYHVVQNYSGIAIINGYSVSIKRRKVKSYSLNGNWHGICTLL